MKEIYYRVFGVKYKNESESDWTYPGTWKLDDCRIYIDESEAKDKIITINSFDELYYIATIKAFEFIYLKESIIKSNKKVCVIPDSWPNDKPIIITRNNFEPIQIKIEYVKCNLSAKELLEFLNIEQLCEYMNERNLKWKFGI